MLNNLQLLEKSSTESKGSEKTSKLKHLNPVFLSCTNRLFFSSDGAYQNELSPQLHNLS